MHIVVFDKQPVAGPGFPHNAHFVHPCHITNKCAEEMSVIHARPRDFSDWIECRRMHRAEWLPACRAILSDPVYRQNDCSHYPRALWQSILRHCFPLVRELYLALSFAERERFERDFATLFFMHAETDSSSLSEQHRGKTLCIDAYTHQVLQIDRKGGFRRTNTLYAVGSMTRGQIIDVSMARSLTGSTDLHSAATGGSAAR